MRREKPALFRNGVISKLFGRASDENKIEQVKEATAEYITEVDRVCEIADGLLMKIELPKKDKDLV